MTFFFSLLFTILTFLGGVEFQDPPNHRIVLSIGGNGQPTAEQLHLADEIGIDLLEVSRTENLSFPDPQRFNYLLDIGPAYAIPDRLFQQMGTIKEEIVLRYRQLDEHTGGRIAAVSILYYPYQSHQDFLPLASALADSLSGEVPGPFFYHSLESELSPVPEGFQFSSQRFESGRSKTVHQSSVHFIPSSNSHQTYTDLNRVLNQIRSFDQSILVFPAAWFFAQLEQRPELQYLYTDHLEGKAVSIPLPAEPDSPPSVNWSVILLLVIWVSFALHYRNQPIYSQSVTRYFTNHGFFVSDVMENRLRNVMPGINLLTQHALLTGLFLYVSAQVLVSPQGLNILEYYFPALFIVDGEPLLSLFLFGILFAIILQGISVIWIFLLNRQLTSFSQILNLYSWPLHLNLLIVTFLVMFNQVGYAERYVMLLSVVFALVWFFSFNVASIDSAKYLKSKRVLFLAATLGIHILIVVGFLIFIFYTPSIIEPLMFAITTA